MKIMSTNSVSSSGSTRNCKFSRRLLLFVLLCMSGTVVDAGNSEAVSPVHGYAMHGLPKYAEGFAHFDYVNPQAPKGGAVKLGVVARGGGFDSFNPYISKGDPADGVGFLFESLTKKSGDEAFTHYGLIAEKMEVPEDRSWVSFHINPKARFSDGKPITTKDVAFSFHTLIEKGSPAISSYWADVEKVEVLSPLKIKFRFKNNQNRELPLILGQLPVLAEHYWKNHDFSKATLDIPVGSGPYKIKSFQAGKSVTYERVKDYWAADLPVEKGFHNFDEITYEYYLDDTVALEAFKAGEFDFRVENTSKTWATAYTGKTFDNGSLIKESIRNNNPTGMQAFVFNTRKEIFADPRVRQALNYAFDFEWLNENLFFGVYTRTNSYFSNSELAATGLPEGEELAILSKYKDQLPAKLFVEPYQNPVTQGDGNNRGNLRAAINLLREAGWVIKNNQLINQKTGQPLNFEIMLVSQNMERVAQAFIKNLEKIGIRVSIRLVDSSQYINRLRSFDFDSILYVIRQSNSPGNEQRDLWSSRSADIEGSQNIIGIKDPVIDELIDLVISAPDREQLIHRTRALDRVLLWNHYVIPNWHKPVHWVAYSAKLKHPAVSPKYELGFETWWTASQQ